MEGEGFYPPRGAILWLVLSYYHHSCFFSHPISSIRFLPLQFHFLFFFGSQSNPHHFTYQKKKTHGLYMCIRIRSRIVVESFYSFVLTDCTLYVIDLILIVTKFVYYIKIEGVTFFNFTLNNFNE